MTTDAPKLTGTGKPDPKSSESLKSSNKETLDPIHAAILDASGIKPTTGVSHFGTLNVVLAGFTSKPRKKAVVKKNARRGRPPLISDERVLVALKARDSGATNRELAQICYGEGYPKPGRCRGIRTLLKKREASLTKSVQNSNNSE